MRCGSAPPDWETTIRLASPDRGGTVAKVVEMRKTRGRSQRSEVRSQKSEVREGRTLVRESWNRASFRFLDLGLSVLRAPRELCSSSLGQNRVTYPFRRSRRRSQ